MPNHPLVRFGYTEATYTDEDGRVFSVLVPPERPDLDPREGVLLGPVAALADLGLPLPLEVALHNGLQSRRIFDYEDARRRPNEVVSAVMAAVKLDAGRVIESYRFPGVD